MWKENIAAENQAEAAQEKQLSKILSVLLSVLSSIWCRIHRRLALICPDDWHNYIYTMLGRPTLDATSQTNRLEAGGAARAGHRESARTRRARPGVRRQRVLRPERSDPGEVRDAPARPIGRPCCRRRGGEVRRV